MMSAIGSDVATWHPPPRLYGDARPDTRPEADRLRSGGSQVVHALTQRDTGPRWAEASYEPPLCTRLGIELPIVQAPIGEGATPELVAAVGGAGALGMLAMSWTEPDEIRPVMQRTRALTPRP